MEAYESYGRDSYGKDQSTGTLPERRKGPKRITSMSIMNWGRRILGEIIDFDGIFFVATTIDKGSGEILKFEDRNNIGK